MRIERIMVGTPSLYCPFPVEIHPRTDTFQKRTSIWLDKYDFFQIPRVRALVGDGQGVEADGLTWPVGDDDDMQVIADWSMLVRVLGDLTSGRDDTAEPTALRETTTWRAAARLIRLLEVPAAELLPTTDPFLAPWRNVARRFNAVATSAQKRRWIDGHRSFLSAIMWQRAFVVAEERLTLNEHASLRIHTSGVGPGRAVIEFTRRIEVPGSEMYSPAVQAINEAWGLLSGWEADLFRYCKYRTTNPERDSGLNLVDLLVLTYGCTAHDALIHAVELRNQVMSLIVRLQAQVVQTASPTLRDYLDGVSLAIRGLLEWRIQSRAASSPSKSADQIWFTPHITRTPAPRHTERIALPAIAWWWDLLES
ncbi:terpene synthase family protein [Kribbella sp. NPDC051587]|uniref:terpene synthase family protein n=1 Tax=Kribbella sp. NPDC051587 TaxID=3364119 RepID=UPI0037A58A69